MRDRLVATVGGVVSLALTLLYLWLLGYRGVSENAVSISRTIFLAGVYGTPVFVLGSVAALGWRRGLFAPAVIGGSTLVILAGRGVSTRAMEAVVVTAIPAVLVSILAMGSEYAVRHPQKTFGWLTIRGAISLGVGASIYLGSWLVLLEWDGTLGSLWSLGWPAVGALCLGGVAGFAVGRERLVTPAAVAILALIPGVVQCGSIEGPTRPCWLSMLFVFGWPLLLVIAGGVGVLECRVRQRLAPLSGTVNG